MECQHSCATLSFDLHRVERAVLARTQSNVNRLYDDVRKRLVRGCANIQRDPVITSIAAVEDDALQWNIARQFVPSPVGADDFNR